MRVRRSSRNSSVARETACNDTQTYALKVPAGRVENGERRIVGVGCVLRKKVKANKRALRAGGSWEQRRSETKGSAVTYLFHCKRVRVSWIHEIVPVRSNAPYLAFRQRRLIIRRRRHAAVRNMRQDHSFRRVEFRRPVGHAVPHTSLISVVLVYEQNFVLYASMHLKRVLFSPPQSASVEHVSAQCEP